MSKQVLPGAAAAVSAAAGPAIGSIDQSPRDQINAGSSKARKPVWNVPAVASSSSPTVNEAPVMGASAWPSLSAATTVRVSPRSSTSSNASSSDGSSSLSSLAIKHNTSPESVLHEHIMPKPSVTLNPNPNLDSNGSPSRGNTNNRNSKWNNNNRRGYYQNNNNNANNYQPHGNPNNYRKNGNNYQHQGNGSTSNNTNGGIGGGAGFRARERNGPNPNWSNNNNNNAFHQRPQHFFRPNPTLAPPPPPPVSYGFAAPPVPPYYAPMTYPEYPYHLTGQLPMMAAAATPLPPYFFPQMVPPVFSTAADLERRDALLKQIEYYFSTENLCKDLYLRSKMDKKEGWVEASLIANFNRVKLLNADVPFIMDVLRASSFIEIQGTKMRTNDWMQWVFPWETKAETESAPITSAPIASA